MSKGKDWKGGPWQQMFE